jgi:hypothetical protein
MPTVSFSLTGSEERQPASDKEYSKTNTNIVNVTNTSPFKTDLVGDKRRAQDDYLVSEILAVCGDAHSTGFYRKLCRTTPPDVIYEALSETRYQSHLGNIRTSRGAFFTNYLAHAKST